MTDEAQRFNRLSDVSLERLGTVGVIRIDRGTSANPARPETMRQMVQLLEEVRVDSRLSAVVLTHAGQHFIAGADFAFLKEIQEATTFEIRDRLYAAFQGAMKTLYSFPKPTVAAIGGAAITVGCEAAIACDFRVVTDRAVFEEGWIRLGTTVPLGGLKMLPALVGYGFASDMILRARRVSGAEAVEVGLANYLVAHDELIPRAVELAEELGRAPPLAYQASKIGLQRALESSFEQMFSSVIATQCLLLKSDDFQEGLAAATERRAPRFEGK